MEVTYTFHNADYFKFHDLSGVINGKIKFEPNGGFTVIWVPFLSPTGDQGLLKIYSNNVSDEPKFEPFDLCQQLIQARDVKKIGEFQYIKMKCIHREEERFESRKATGHIFEMKSWNADRKRFLWLSEPSNNFWDDPFCQQTSDYTDIDEIRRVWPHFAEPKFFCQGYLKHSPGSKFGSRYQPNERFLHSDFGFVPFRFKNFHKLWSKIYRDVKRKLEYQRKRKEIKNAGLPDTLVEPNYSHIFQLLVSYHFFSNLITLNIGG